MQALSAQTYYSFTVCSMQDSLFQSIHNTLLYVRNQQDFDTANYLGFRHVITDSKDVDALINDHQILIFYLTDSIDDWNRVKASCNYSPLVKVALKVNSGTKYSSWKAEPVDVVVIEGTDFSVPSILPFMEYPVKVIVKSATVQGIEKCVPLLFQSYDETRVAKSQLEQASDEYADCLQIPLQPLQDNLHHDTYAVFEQDETKYNLYQEAITTALSESRLDVLRVLVAGAGRGPLVQNVLRAAHIAGKRVEVTALEKNPDAFTFLQLRKKNEWMNVSICLVRDDMRRYVPTQKFDIIVSELLGSFGDNEVCVCITLGLP